MTDRPIVYPSAIPQDTDILNTNRFAMVALGYLAEACIGTTTAINGLACLPTSPTADLHVTVARGAIFSMQVVDASSYGSLPADTSDPLMKIGINAAATVFTITPPSQAGYSQNFLIEAQFSEQSSGNAVLSYYNSLNPAQPFQGQAGSGTAQPTLIVQRVSLQVKPGAAAPAGTQLTPGADAGWTPLWLVSVNAGQTQITSTSISAAAGSPFLLSQLSQQRHKLTSNLTLYVSSTNGSDANNGLQSATPFATIQAALNAVSNSYDLNGYGVTISVGAGQFASATATGLPVGYGAASFLNVVGSGPGTIIASTGGTGGINSSGGASVGVSNLTVQGSTGLQAYGSGSLTIMGGIVFGSCTSAHINASGNVYIAGNYSISGGATQHFITQGFGQVYVTGAYTVTITTAVTFSVAFAEASGALIQTSAGGASLTFAGAGNVTGQRYISQLGATISTNGGGPNYFPGSTAGSSGTGYYV